MQTFLLYSFFFCKICVEWYFDLAGLRRGLARVTPLYDAQGELYNKQLGRGRGSRLLSDGVSWDVLVSSS